MMGQRAGRHPATGCSHLTGQALQQGATVGWKASQAISSVAVAQHPVSSCPKLMVRGCGSQYGTQDPLESILPLCRGPRAEVCWHAESRGRGRIPLAPCSCCGLTFP